MDTQQSSGPKSVLVIGSISFGIICAIFYIIGNFLLERIGYPFSYRGTGGGFGDLSLIEAIFIIFAISFISTWWILKRVKNSNSRLILVCLLILFVILVGPMVMNLIFIGHFSHQGIYSY